MNGVAIDLASPPVSSMKHLLVVTNAYLHDFASALWGACVFVVYRLGTRTGEGATGGLGREFFLMGAVSLAVIVATGVGRTMAYRSGAFGEEAESNRRRLLVVKHLAGAVVYGGGTWWMYAAAY